MLAVRCANPDDQRSLPWLYGDMAGPMERTLQHPIARCRLYFERGYGYAMLVGKCLEDGCNLRVLQRRYQLNNFVVADHHGDRAVVRAKPRLQQRRSV